MTLREEILKEHSRDQCQKIVRWVGDSQERFDDLFHLFLSDEQRVTQRAAWPLSYCVAAHPDFISRKLEPLLKNLHKAGLHNAVKRNTMRLLQVVDIPEEFQGEVMDTCFQYIASPHEPVAIKAFSLSVLDNLSKSYPEIIPEIKLLIEERWDYESAAFKSRARKILKKTG